MADKLDHAGGVVDLEGDAAGEARRGEGPVRDHAQAPASSPPIARPSAEAQLSASRRGVLSRPFANLAALRRVFVRILAELAALGRIFAGTSPALRRVVSRTDARLRGWIITWTSSRRARRVLTLGHVASSQLWNSAPRDSSERRSPCVVYHPTPELA